MWNKKIKAKVREEIRLHDKENGFMPADVDGKSHFTHFSYSYTYNNNNYNEILVGMCFFFVSRCEALL